MSQAVEIARTRIIDFKHSPVGDAKQLQDSLLLAESNPKLIAEKFLDYYHVIRDLFSLTPEELKIITAVNQKMGTGRGADKFLEVLGDQKDQVLGAIRQMGDPDNPNNQQGLETLTEMMNNARNKKQADENWVPKDGDPEADRVIWGFVKGANSAETDIDLAICHGIERTLTVQMDPKNEYTGHKDWLLIAMNDVVALRGLRGQGREAKVLKLWSTPRPDGLGWVSERRLEAYKQELGK